MVTKSKINKFMKATEPDIIITVNYSFEDIEFDVKVKTILTVEEKATFIERVADNCFDGDGDFHPELLKPLFDIAVLQVMTDIPPCEEKTEDGEEVVNIEKTATLCKRLSFFEKIEQEDFKKTYEELWKLTNERIEYLKSVYIAGERNKLEYIQNELELKLTELENISEQLNAVMENVFKDDKLVNMVKSMTSRINSIDDAKLVDIIAKKSE